MVERQLDLDKNISKDSETFMIKYSGPSFDGKIEISSLKKQLTAIEKITKAILVELNDKKKISLDIGSVEICVNAQKGSYEQFFSIFYNKAILDGLLACVYFYIFTKASGQIWGNLSERVRNKLDSKGGEVFYEEVIQRIPLKDFSNILAPLKCDSDGVAFYSSSFEDVMKIDYSEKLEVKEKIKDIVENAPIITRPEILFGLITRIDVEHGIKYRFLSNDCSHAIGASFNQKMDLETIAKLIGREIRIDADVDYRAGESIRLTIKNHHLIKQSLDNF